MYVLYRDEAQTLIAQAVAVLRIDIDVGSEPVLQVPGSKEPATSIPIPEPLLEVEVERRWCTLLRNNCAALVLQRETLEERKLVAFNLDDYMEVLYQPPRWHQKASQGRVAFDPNNILAKIEKDIETLRRPLRHKLHPHERVVKRPCNRGEHP